MQSLLESLFDSIDWKEKYVAEPSTEAGVSVIMFRESEVQMAARYLDTITQRDNEGAHTLFLHEDNYGKALSLYYLPDALKKQKRVKLDDRKDERGDDA